MNSDQTHVFWNCTKIQPFWEMLHDTICEVLQYEIPNTCLVMYLGGIEEHVHEEDEYILKILLAAGKKAITRNWLKAEVPDCEQWREIIDKIKEMERLTFKIRLRKELYDRRWEKWNVYCDQ